VSDDREVAAMLPALRSIARTPPHVYIELDEPSLLIVGLKPYWF
jgi:hypothetical protein